MSNDSKKATNAFGDTIETPKIDMETTVQVDSFDVQQALADKGITMSIEELEMTKMINIANTEELKKAIMNGDTIVPKKSKKEAKAADKALVKAQKEYDKVSVGNESSYSSADFILMNLNSTYDDKFHVAYVDNTAGKEHLTTSFGTERGANSGAGNSPSWIAVNGKYASTDRITSVTIHNTASGFYDEGSEVVVLGWDPDDTHTTGFWQELDSVNHTGGDTRKISTTNTVDKRYMWVQGYIKQDSTYALGMVVNDDGSATSPSNNYAFAFRGNYNSTISTNENTWTLDPTWSTLAGGGVFVNSFIANKLNKDKFALNQHAENPATGSGLGAEPHSMWSTGKWGGNALITKINYITEGTSQGQLKNGSKFKVWGSD